MRRAVLPAVLLCLGAAPAMAQNPAAGREVAIRWCVNCHVVGPDQTRGADQAPTFQTIANRKESTAGSLKAFLELPNHRMPYQNLTNVELDAVTAYILSLKR